MTALPTEGVSNSIPTQDTLSIVTDFYDAVWDLAESLLVLTSQSRLTPTAVAQSGEHALDVVYLRKAFNDKAASFLALKGTDIPPETHIYYDHVEETMQESITPALNSIVSTWQNIYPHPNKPDVGNPFNEMALRQYVKDKAIDLKDDLEMTCIVQLKALLTELQAVPH